MLSRRKFIKNLTIVSLASLLDSSLPSLLNAKNTIDSRRELSTVITNYPEFPVVNVNQKDYGVGITKNDFYLIFQKDNYVVDDESIIQKVIFTNLMREKIKNSDISDLELKLETINQLSNEAVIKELSDLIDVFEDKESEAENFTINPYKVVKNILNSLNEKYINPVFYARGLILKQSNPILYNFEQFIELVRQEHIRSQKENELRQAEFQFGNTAQSYKIEYFDYRTALQTYNLSSKTQKIIEPAINFLRILRNPSEFYKIDQNNMGDLKAIIYKNPDNIYVKSELQRIGENIAQQIKASPEFKQFEKEKREISLKWRNLRNEMHNARFLTSI